MTGYFFLCSLPGGLITGQVLDPGFTGLARRDEAGSDKKKSKDYCAYATL